MSARGLSHPDATKWMAAAKAEGSIAAEPSKKGREQSGQIDEWARLPHSLSVQADRVAGELIDRGYSVGISDVRAPPPLRPAPAKNESVLSRIVAISPRPLATRQTTVWKE